MRHTLIALRISSPHGESILTFDPEEREAIDQIEDALRGIGRLFEQRPYSDFVMGKGWKAR